MTTVTEPARTIPVVREADVVIVGGGPAGLAAAIASARAGARTVLVEQFGYLGGTATASLMACINGFRNQVEPDTTQVVRGIAEEIVLRLKDLHGLGKSPYPQKAYPTTPGQLEYSYAIDTEKFKYVTLKMAVDAGVDLLLHTYFCDVIAEGAAVRGIVIENKSGRQAILARVVVDASGDGDVAFRSGAPFWQIYKDEAPRLNDALMYRIAFGAGRPAGIYACDFGNTAVVWGPGVGPIDGADGEALSRAEVQARLQVYEDFSQKQAKNPELADARLVGDAAPAWHPPDPLHRRRVQDHGGGRHRGAPLPRRGGHQSLSHHPLLWLPSLLAARGLRHPLSCSGAPKGREPIGDGTLHIQ